MVKRIVFCAALLTAQAALAEDLPQAPSPAGSPSDATATASPSSVAQAFDQPDPSASEFDVSLGTSIASGHFGAPLDSHIWSTALGLRYATGGFRLTASIPYMRIRTAGTILTGIDSTPVLIRNNTTARRATYKGVGDLTLGASYTLPSASSGLEVELSGRVKLPTASDSSQLSSGKTDYSAGVQVTKTIGRFAPFVSGTYRIFGDPAAIELKDGFAGSIGTSIVASDQVVLLASYHYAEKASRTVQDSHELFAGASILLDSDKLRLTAFATKGLSSGAAGVSGGLGLSLSL